MAPTTFSTPCARRPPKHAQSITPQDSDTRERPGVLTWNATCVLAGSPSSSAACSGFPSLSVPTLYTPTQPPCVPLLSSESTHAGGCLVGHSGSEAEAEAALAAVQVLGNIAVGSAAQTQFVLDAGGLTLLRDLLASHRTGPLLAEACFAAANIAAGTRAQIQVLLLSSSTPWRTLSTWEDSAGEQL